MGVKKPADLSKAFENFFNARDKNSLMALYADQAMLTMDGATKFAGKGDIEKTLAAQMASPNKVVCTCVTCHEAGDTALLRTDWQTLDPKGTVIMKGLSAEVAKRGTDGLWRFIIDDTTYASR